MDWVASKWEDLDVRGRMVKDKPCYVDGVLPAWGGDDAREMTPEEIEWNREMISTARSCQLGEAKCSRLSDLAGESLEHSDAREMTPCGRLMVRCLAPSVMDHTLANL